MCIAVWVAGGLLGCSGPTVVDSPVGLASSKTASVEHYLAAVADAAMVEETERAHDLVAVTTANTRLHWRDFDAVPHVLVVTWTSWSGYGDHLGGALDLEREVWVTVVPDVVEFCKGYDGDDIKLRLEQLIGLPPQGNKHSFAEMWVSPSDLFRPCPDAEIDDTVCELDFPTKPPPSDEHRRWIEHTRATSWTGDNPYPWTALGYTYDWAPTSREQGLSEFVVRAGARVHVEKLAATADYCGGATAR